jgi:hypothetical protein
MVLPILEVGPKACDFGDDWLELVWKHVEKLNRGGYEVKICVEHVEDGYWH